MSILYGQTSHSNHKSVKKTPQIIAQNSEKRHQHHRFTAVAPPPRLPQHPHPFLHKSLLTYSFMHPQGTDPFTVNAMVCTKSVTATSQLLCTFLAYAFPAPARGHTSTHFVSHTRQKLDCLFIAASFSMNERKCCVKAHGHGL